MSDLARLELRFNKHKEEMSRYDLIELIELLQKRRDDLMDTIEDISDQQDRDIEKEPHNYKEDMD